MSSNTKMTAALLGMLAASAIAAPAAAPAPSPEPNAPSPIDKRQTVSTYTCVMNAAATNSELVGGPIISRNKDKRDAFPLEKRQDPEPGDLPLAGAAMLPNTFASSTGLTIGIAGATQPLYSNTGFNVWDMAEGQTISASDTGLPMDVTYYNEGGIPTFSCGMSYNGVAYDCDTSDDIEILFFGSSSTQKGQVQFPCEMTPPGSTSDSPAYAPGWCTTHVVQYQKPDPSTDPYTLDVYVYDNAGTPIGQTLGAVTETAVTGSLPYTFDVGTGGVDDDPVTFAYGDQSWDSNDSTDHQCSVGSYDSGSRSMDCGFTC